MTTALIVASVVLLCVPALAAGEGPEAAPAPFQTTPRPAEGEMVSANPPCFVFPARTSADAFVVECAGDAAFPEAGTVRLTSPYMLAVPAEPLKPGRYFWRWRPGRPGDGEADWSPVRAFTVPAGAPIVPFPDIDAIVRRIGRSHPRVGRVPATRAGAAELAGLRRRAAETFGPAWRDGVGRYAAQMRDRPLLPEPAFLPDPRDPRRIELYQKTFQTTRPFMRELATLAENYLLTGDELSGQEAKRRLLHIVSWDPRGSTSLEHNDEPATEVVRYGPTAFDRVYPLLAAEEKRRCLECLLVRMREMRDRWRRRPFEVAPYESHNMGYYLPDLLEASLALAGEAPVEEMLRYTLLQLWSPFYPPYGGADGGWCEGPSYWGWSTSVFARAYRLAAQVTGVPVHLRSNVRNMWAYKLYGNPPYFQLSPFGDGQEAAAAGGGTMLLLAALYDNPYARWYGEQQSARLSGMDALLFDLGRTESRPPDDLPQGRAFFDIGLATMHTALADAASNVAVLLRSCPFGSISHAFADQNNFVLDAYGEPLIIASGYYQLYGHPHHADWTRQTKASNSVLVDGEGQVCRDWNARGRLATFRTTAAGDYAVGDAHEAYGGRLDRFDRRVVFLRPLHTGGEPILVLRDELAAPRPATYQFLLHALNRMEVDPARQQVTIARRASRCRVQFLAPQGLTFDQHDRFPQPPFRAAPNQWHLSASTVERSATAGSLIVLQPYRENHEQELLAAEAVTGAGGVGVRLTGEGRTVLVVFRTDPAAPSIRLSDLSTDAQAASVCLIGSQVRSAALFGGTELRWAGRKLLASSAPAAVSGSRWSDRGPPQAPFLRRGGCSTCGGRRLIASDAPPGTRLSAELGARDSWTQGDGPWLKAAGERDGPVVGSLEVEGRAAGRFETLRYDPVQRLVARARVPGSAALYAVEATVGNAGDGALPVVLTAGTATARRVLAPGLTGVKLALPAANLGAGRDVALTADEALGGRLVLERASARRAYGINLVPNGAFEEVADGAPLGWQAATISQGAQAAIATAEGGRGGGRCLKVTCTEATGGDFGAVLAWPGIAPSDVDRKFRMSCWVRTDAGSEAGLQVTSADWSGWQNTERLRDRKEWTETALEFVLPAGQDLTHVRLHMHAARAGAELFVDDVALVELPDGRELRRGKE